jgi:hypothetical protein
MQVQFLKLPMQVQVLKLTLSQGQPIEYRDLFSQDLETVVPALKQFRALQLCGGKEKQ